MASILPNKFELIGIVVVMIILWMIYQRASEAAKPVTQAPVVSQAGTFTRPVVEYIIPGGPGGPF